MAAGAIAAIRSITMLQTLTTPFHPLDSLFAEGTIGGRGRLRLRFLSERGHATRQNNS
jgi:hypothetical protein